MLLSGNFALKPLQIGEIMSNNEITYFFYFYWKSSEKKADEKKTLFQDRICYDCDIACASGKMHHGILFDPPLALIYYTQDFRVYEGTRDQPMPGPFPAPPIF